MKRTLTGLLLGAGLLLPTCLLAQPAPDDHRDHPDEHRYYDSNHKDYHEWNDHEGERTACTGSSVMATMSIGTTGARDRRDD